MWIRGVLFDFDDTLTKAGGLDYARIRADIGCPEDASILSYIDTIQDMRKREEARNILKDHEIGAAARAKPAIGAEDLIIWLQKSNIGRGIITRNTRQAVDISFRSFKKVGSTNFNIIVTRDDNIPVKPEPDGVLLVCAKLYLQPDELLVVGDYIYDVQAGASAGSVTVFFDSRPNRAFEPPPSDYTITEISEIRQLVINHS